MLTLFFSEKPVQNSDDASSADHARFADFFSKMLANSVHLPPSGYEAWFVSLAHDERVVNKTIEAARKSLV